MQSWFFVVPSSPVTLFFVCVCAGQGESTSAEDDVVKPQHVGSGAVLVPPVSRSVWPCGQPGAAAPLLPHTRPQCWGGRHGEGGVQPGLSGSHGLVSGTIHELC